jgi:hypothetical protein
MFRFSGETKNSKALDDQCRDMRNSENIEPKRKSPGDWNRQRRTRKRMSRRKDRRRDMNPNTRKKKAEET